MENHMRRIVITALALLFTTSAFAEAGNAKSVDYKIKDSDSPKASFDAKKMEESRSAHEVISNATRVYQEFTSSPQKVPTKVLAQAKCVVVFPNAITAAAVVGGTHADGVASCKNEGKWSAPTLVDLNAASLGAQIGGKSTDIVLFFNDDKSASVLRRGKFEVGVDASVALGNYDSAAEATGSSVIAYQRSEGAYIGASIGGGTISADEKANRSIYGNESNFGALIGGKTAPSNADKKFTDSLPS